MKTIFKIFTIIIMLACAILSGIYFFSAKFYGNFTCVLLTDKNKNVTENYEIYGVSFFNKEYPLLQENGFARNYDGSFYRQLKFEHKKGEQAKSIIIQKSGVSICNKIKFSSKFNETNGLPDANLREKLKTNPLLLISLIISLISLLLCTIILTKFYIRNSKTKKIIYCSIPTITIILSCTIIFITCEETNKTHLDLNQVRTFKLNSNSQNIISISDTIGQPFEFTFSLDNKFWMDKESIINYISNIEVKDTFNTSKFIIQAWKFVYENTFHCYQKYTEPQFEGFDCYTINSIGHGLCHDRAILFCDIVKERGYETRIFNNPNTHTFPEVFDGKWKMMDVDYGICFCDRNQNILSIEEIQNSEHQLIRAMDKMSFFSNAETFLIDTPPDLNSGNKYCSKYTKLQQHQISELKLSNFSLPANSTIIMPIYDSTLIEYTAKIIIPTSDKQNIRIPLVIKSHNADMFTRISSFDYIVSGKNIEITALLNPMLFMNAKNLKVCSTSKLKINVEPHYDSSDIYFILNNFTNENYDTIRFLHRTEAINAMNLEDLCPDEINFFRKYHEKVHNH